jgi:hypothetical protein
MTLLYEAALLVPMAFLLGMGAGAGVSAWRSLADWWVRR